MDFKESEGLKTHYQHPTVRSPQWSIKVIHSSCHSSPTYLHPQYSQRFLQTTQHTQSKTKFRDNLVSVRDWREFQTSAFCNSQSVCGHHLYSSKLWRLTSLAFKWWHGRNLPFPTSRNLSVKVYFYLTFQNLRASNTSEIQVMYISSFLILNTYVCICVLLEI